MGLWHQYILLSKAMRSHNDVISPKQEIQMDSQACLCFTGVQQTKLFSPPAKSFLVKKILTILKVSTATDISKSDLEIRTFFLIVLLCT